MIQFFVEGTPAPGGSKRGIPLQHKGVFTGRVAMMDAAGERNKNWRQSVAFFARQAYNGPLLDEPLRVSMTFYMRRPKGHYGKKGLRPSARPYPNTKPDVLKLARSTEDALSGIVWTDDNQTIKLVLEKAYVHRTERAGAMVKIEPIGAATP